MQRHSIQGTEGRWAFGVQREEKCWPCAPINSIPRKIPPYCGRNFSRHRFLSAQNLNRMVACISLGAFNTAWPPPPGTPKNVSPTEPSIGPKTWRLKAFGMSSLNMISLPSRIDVRLMTEKSSLTYPGLRNHDSATGRFPKTYPPPAANDAALGSNKAAQLYTGVDPLLKLPVPAPLVISLQLLFQPALVAGLQWAGCFKKNDCPGTKLKR